MHLHQLPGDWVGASLFHLDTVGSVLNLQSTAAAAAAARLDSVGPIMQGIMQGGGAAVPSAGRVFASTCTRTTSEIASPSATCACDSSGQAR
jgi:hypothetical protein